MDDNTLNNPMGTLATSTNRCSSAVSWHRTVFMGICDVEWGKEEGGLVQKKKLTLTFAVKMLQCQHFLLFPLSVSWFELKKNVCNVFSSCYEMEMYIFFFKLLKKFLIWFQKETLITCWMFFVLLL